MDFALMASDQIANQAGKWHFMSGGQTTVPMVIRCSVGAGKGYGGQHSQSLESLFTHLPGLVVAYPSTAADAKGMLKAAIRSDDPVLFCESQGLYAARGPVPEDEYLVPLGKSARRARGWRCHHRGLGPGRARCAQGGRGARRRRHRVRCHRPPHAGAAGHGDGAGIGRQDRPLRRRRPGHPVGQLRQRGRGPRRQSRPSTTSTRRSRASVPPTASARKPKGLEAAFLPNAGDIAESVRGLI